MESNAFGSMERKPDDIASISCQDVKEILATGLAPLHEQLLSMERSLGLLANQSRLSFQGDTEGFNIQTRNRFDKSICEAKPSDAFKDPVEPFRVDFLKDSAAVLGDVARLEPESEGNVSNATADDEAETPRRMQSDIHSKHSCSHVITGGIGDDSLAALQTLIFQREMDIMGVSGKSRYAHLFMNLRIWFHKQSHKMENEPERTGCIAKVVQRRGFEGCSMFVIFCSTVFAGYNADWRMANTDNDPPDIFFALGDIFTAVFSVELVLRLWTHRLYFFTNMDRGWNWLDFVTVGISVAEAAVQRLSDGSGGSVSFMRMMRLAKLAKILRALRAVRFFKELSVLVNSFRSSITIMFWFAVLMAILLFICSLILLHGFTEYLDQNRDLLDEKSQREILYWFGTLMDSMLTLIWSVTNGIEWGSIYVIIAPAGGIYCVAYLTFTITFLIVFINIVTGTLVEKALAATEPGRHDLIMSQRKKKHQEAKEFKHLCQLMDTDNDGRISWHEFVVLMKNEVFVTYMVSIGLDVNNVDLFFKTLIGTDGSDNDSIPLDDFVHGCMNMSGNATAIDVQKLLYVTSRLQTDMLGFQQEARCNMERIENTLGQVSTGYSACSALDTVLPQVPTTKDVDIGKCLPSAERVSFAL